jgi:hypothetical protein
LLFSRAGKLGTPPRAYARASLKSHGRAAHLRRRPSGVGMRAAPITSASRQATSECRICDIHRRAIRIEQLAVDLPPRTYIHLSFSMGGSQMRSLPKNVGKIKRPICSGFGFAKPSHVCAVLARPLKIASGSRAAPAASRRGGLTTRLTACSVTWIGAILRRPGLGFPKPRPWALRVAGFSLLEPAINVSGDGAPTRRRKPSGPGLDTTHR